MKGGYAVAPVMGSKSTYLRGGFGGFEGRALRKGDMIAIVEAADHSTGNAIEADEARRWPFAESEPHHDYQYVYRSTEN